MILRLRVYRLLLKICTYLLPLPAFALGLWSWTGLCRLFSRPSVFSAQTHLAQLLLGGIAWALLSERYDVTKFDELFRERTGARNASSACIATAFVLLICDLFALLMLTILLHATFRICCRSRAYPSRPTRLLIVGADQFAVDV